MKTIYLTDGTEIKRDSVDARDYVNAGLATYEKPSRVESVKEDEQIEQVVQEEKPKRGRPFSKDKE
jgi:hypothetical protein